MSPESFVTDVDVRGSRAWYNTVKMAVFTSFVIATASDDEIHKQPPTVDLHIQMGFFFYFCDEVSPFLERYSVMTNTGTSIASRN